jgi:NhaP-type Na+/H+ or K+/H+ antiporter
MNLRALLYGEGILNNAISFVMYRTIGASKDIKDLTSGQEHIIFASGYFALVFVCSCLIGVLAALIISLVKLHLIKRS